MIDCISVENMRQSDAHTIEHFVPSLELMYRAAFGVFQAVKWHGEIAIITGSGNNGGDGFALACILKERGFSCYVYTVGRRLSGDSRHYAEKAEAMGVAIQPLSTIASLAGNDFVVDCLLGTGFQGSVREDCRLAIEMINASNSYVVSVDVNSGMNGDSGAGETVVKSDLTVTIGYVKNGLITAAAGLFMKRLICVDIGILLVQKQNFICTPDEWSALCQEHEIGETECCFSRDGHIYYRCPEWLVT